MAFPDDPLPDPSTWFSMQLITAAMIKQQIIDPLNLLRLIAVDSGPQTTGGMNATAATGWGTVTENWRKFGPFVEVAFTAIRTGAAITANSAGNITDSVVLTISGTGYVPVVPRYGAFSASSTSGGVILNPTNLVITDAHPTSVINTGDAVRASFVYTA
jgi:hypothetical protein